MWSDVTNLRFAERYRGRRSEVDIAIDFSPQEHGGRNDPSFDGPGDVLAHAFFPRNGDIHFDNSEFWITPNIRKTN